MIVELRDKAQITIPKEIVRMLSLSKGDKFEVVEVNGEIHLIPVVVYPKEVINELEAVVRETMAKKENGELKVYDNLEELFASLKGKHEV